jgi:hypothetical protein
MKKICTAILIVLTLIGLNAIPFSSADSIQILEIDLYTYGPRWDINNDGIADTLDVSLLTNEYGNESATPGWIREDIVENAKVDIEDISMYTKHHGESWLIT